MKKLWQKAKSPATAWFKDFHTRILMRDFISTSIRYYW
jgi:hypothetical protein